MSADVPLSVGVLEPHSDPLHLNTIEFLWDPSKNASVFIQVQRNGWTSSEQTRRMKPGKVQWQTWVKLVSASVVPYHYWSWRLPQWYCTNIEAGVCLSGTNSSFTTGKLHQYGVHTQKAWRRERCSFSHSGGYLHHQRTWRVCGPRALIQLPDQGFQSRGLLVFSDFV